MNKLLRLVILPSFVMLIVAISCSNQTASTTKTDSTGVATEETDQQSETSAVEYLTTEQFKALVFDFSKEKEWKYVGKTPCVIDFYADWCGPCKRVAPIMEELAKQYEGKVKFYKVNTDKERELASAFNITGIPSILFVPQNGQPQMTSGAYPKEDYIKLIEQNIFGKK